METFDRAACRVLREDLDAALAAVAEKHGITLKTGGMRFTDATVTIQVEAALPGRSKNSEAFNRHAHVFGLEQEDLGRELTINGWRLRIAGLRPNAPKRPVLLDRVGSKGQVVATVEDVLRALGRSATVGGSR